MTCPTDERAEINGMLPRRISRAWYEGEERPSARI